MNTTTAEMIKAKAKDLFLPLIAAFISGTAFCKYVNITTTNIFSLIFLFLLFHLYRATFFTIKNRRLKIVSYICGFLYTASFVLVKLNELLEDPRPAYATYVAIFYVVGFLLFFSNLIILIYNRLLKTEFCIDKRGKGTPPLSKRAIFYISSMLLMLLIWLPYFLRNFPGDITTDSHDELLQAIGTAPYSNHHPIAHTMMIKLFYNLGLGLFDGDQTLAVATYSVCQAILLSAAFAFLLVTLYKFKVRKAVILAVFGFYTVIPYHGVYSVTMWKDIWFGGIVVVLSTVIWRLVRHYREQNKKLPLFELVMFFIFGVAMCLFRSNGLYAYILLVPFICILFIRKNIVPVILSVLVLPVSFAVKGPVYDSMGVTPPDTIESLSIPAQHIARAIKDGAVLTPDEYVLLENVVDVEQISERYSPHISDPIKNLVRETDNQEYIEEHKMDFLDLWIDLGLAYPKSYILAQIDQTYGYWYPDVQYWLYAGEFRGSGDGYEVQKDMKISDGMNETISYYLESYRDVSYWGLFWSIGTYSWVAVFMFGLCIIKRNKSYILVYIPVLAVLATLMIATPVFAEFRYAYSIFTTIPLLCIVPFCKSGKEKNESKEITDTPTDNTSETTEDTEISENNATDEADKKVSDTAEDKASEVNFNGYTVAFDNENVKPDSEIIDNLEKASEGIHDSTSAITN